MRYTGKIQNISYEATHAFFESRGKHASVDNPQTATMYQDNSLSMRRDVWERDHVTPLLELTGEDRILDIGCGYGRWAAALQNKYQSYWGIDFSAELLNLAVSKEYLNATFRCMPAQEISRENLQYESFFDLFLCSGILIYLNDRDVTKLSESIIQLASPDARIYLREPMAVTGDRLTLDCYHSDELNADYSAVYRTPEECSQLFGEPLRSAGFTCVLEHSLYPEELCNRKETEQQIQIWKRDV